MMQDGMCILGDDMYSRTYRFDDVNYRLNRRDDQEQTFIKFCEMYNYLDPETFFQILLVNRTGDSNNFMDQMFYPLHGDGYDAYRKEVNSVISKRGLEGNNISFETALLRSVCIHLIRRLFVRSCLV